jgi:sigma54-dependent transcription regulator
MNERIKELLAQAYDEAVPETWTTLSSEQLDRIYEKFAKLILEDVMSICEDLGDKSLDGHHCVDAISKKYEMHQWSPH